MDYKKHVEVERMILKLGKRDNLKSFIINCGLLLHPADNILHMMFKVSIAVELLISDRMRGI